jgi:AraC-like DNA-binding protein
VFFLPNSEYKYTYSGGDELSYFWVHFTGSEAKERLDEFDIQSFPKIYKTLSSDRVSRRFQALFDAYEKRDIYRDRELSAIMERLLVAVAREIDRDSAEMTTLSKSIGYIVSNYSSDIMIPELAKMEHLSTSRYNYLFKLITGMSPKKYILQLRMSSAAELIRSTDLPLKQIGLMCGYADAYFFSKTFKAFFGVSPREYKKGKRE